MCECKLQPHTCRSPRSFNVNKKFHVPYRCNWRLWNIVNMPKVSPKINSKRHKTTTLTTELRELQCSRWGSNPRPVAFLSLESNCVTNFWLINLYLGILDDRPSFIHQKMQLGIFITSVVTCICWKAPCSSKLALSRLKSCNTDGETILPVASDLCFFLG